jgi:hypothetical protein
MQIMKLLPAVCAVALGASFLSAHAGDTPVQAAARAAFEQEMKDLDKPQTGQSATNLAKPAPTNTATATQPGTVPAANPVVTAPHPAPTAIAPAAAAAVVMPNAAEPTPVPGVPNSKSQVTAVIPGKELGLRSIEAPLVPITEAQLQELHDLLAKYKLNEITPAEYHRQRAEILGQSRP